MSAEVVDIYVRLSIHDDSKDGLERQESELRKWAEETHRTVRKVWRDPGVSAFKQVERPEFANATKALLAGEVSSLLVWKLDRLSRRGAGQVGTLLDNLEKAKARICFYKDNLSTDQESHRQMIIWASEQARAESKNTSLRIHSKNQALMNAGLPPLGKRRFGYLPADKAAGRVVNTVEHPDEGPVIRNLFADYINGASVVGLAKKLGWRPLRVRETLSNAAYAGTLKLGDQTYPAAEHVARLVSEEDFQTTQARLSSRSEIYRGFNKGGGQVKHLASGLARCGVCDATVMFRNTYVCSKVPTRHFSITEKSLDKLVMAKTVEILLDPDFSVELEPGGRTAKQINDDLAQTEADIQDVLSGLSSGLRMGQLLPHLKPLQERQTALQQELEAYAASSVQARILNDIAQSMRRAAEVWTAKPPSIRTQRLHASLAYDALPLHQKRELVEGLFSIVVHPGRGTGRVEMSLKRA